jgi:hypothetical protein
MDNKRGFDRKAVGGSLAITFTEADGGRIRLGLSRDPEARHLYLREPGTLLIGIINLPTWNKAAATLQRLHVELASHRIVGTAWFKFTRAEAEKLVVLVSADVEARSAAPGRLTAEQRAAQEATWYAAGIQAFKDGIPQKNWPRVLPKYSAVWYRAKRAWQDGWKDAAGVPRES